MSRTYYVIELTPKWLAILLVAFVGVMVLAFVGGYGAAWSTLGGSLASGDAGPTADPTAITEVDVEATPSPPVVLSKATPNPQKPTVVPVVESVRPDPTATPAPKPTATPVPKPTPTRRPQPPKQEAAAEEYAVQVLASSGIQAIERARQKLVELGFPNDTHDIVESRVAGGGILLKLRIGPFPDRASADRVMERMQGGGFPDAWVVRP